MGTTEKTVRQTVAARIAAIGTPWNESKFVPSLLGIDPSSLAHGAFSVELPNGRTTGGRQKRPDNLEQAETTVIRFTWQVKPMNQVESYDSALDAELLLIQTLLATGWTSNFRFIYVSSLRSPVETGEWIRVEISFNALFYLNLE